MADITLKTRLLNKYNQNLAADHVLGKGEINFVEVDIPLGNGEKGKAVLIKVGDGSTLYGNLDFVAAKAADVYDWAKAATKPEYQASEIKNLASYIAGKVQDTNTKYEFNISEDGKLVVNEKELSGATSTVATLDFVTPTELNTILEGYVSETELADALDDYLTTAAFDTFKGSNTTAIADAKKAGTDASDALAAYKTANDAALAGVKATAEAATTVEEVNAQIDTKITALKDENLWDVSGAAAAAQEAAISAASADATSKANAAQTAAISAAAADAKTKADAAEAAAKAYADGLASNYEEAGAAAKAQAAAISAAAADATSKANAAQTAAEAYADGIKADLLGEGAISETYDTLKEIADWIEGNGVDATELTSAIAAEAKTREDADKALSSRIQAYEDAKDTYATVEALNGVKATAEAAQTATQVSDAIDTKINALNLDTRFDNDYDAKGAADTALEAAKADAKSKADAALEAAKSDATSKANKALQDAKDYADKLNHEDTTYEAGEGLTLNVVDGKNIFALDTSVVFVLDGNQA